MAAIGATRRLKWPRVRLSLRTLVMDKQLEATGAVLLADDDSNDVFFLRRAFQKAGFASTVFDVPDGEKAIEYLCGENHFSDRTRYPIPALLMLDLKMPKINGFEVLEWLKTRKELCGLKVVVLSSSGLAADQQKAKDLGAHEYRVKPADLEDMVNMIKEVAGRWLH